MGTNVAGVPILDPYIVRCGYADMVADKEGDLRISPCCWDWRYFSEYPDDERAALASLIQEHIDYQWRRTHGLPMF